MSDVDRYEHHPGDYQMSEYGGVYRVKSRLAAGLPPIANNADAEVIMAACMANLGATGGVIRLAPRTTFDFGDTVHVTTKICIVGGGPTTICRPAAGPWAKALFDLDEEFGGAARQEDNQLRNFQIDMRSIADSDGIHIHNTKNLLIEDVQVRFFEQYGIYHESDNSQYTFGVWMNRLFFEADGATAGIYALDTTDGFLDSWVTNSYGNLVSTDYGVYLGCAGNLNISRMHVVAATNAFYFAPNEAAGGGVVFDINLHRPVIDYITGHGILLHKTHGSMEDITIAYPHFIHPPDNFDLIHIDLAGTNLKRLHVIGATTSGVLAHEYFVNTDDATKMEDCLFRDNRIAVGGTGTYNNVPTHQIIRDRTDITSSYQLEAGGAWVGPVWVGTPPNGWDLEMYNSNLGEYRHYAYLNAGWRMVALA